MTNERMTLEEIEKKYPDEWLLIVDCEINENTELLSGVVAVHSKSRKDIHDALMNHKGRVAIHSTRMSIERSFKPVIQPLAELGREFFRGSFCGRVKNLHISHPA